MSVITLDYNQQIVNDIMDDWNCTELEAWVALEYDCETLEETQGVISTAVTHNRLLVSLLPGAIQFLRDEFYKYKNVSDDFILSEAKEMVAEQADMFSRQWKQLDDYEDMSEAEKRTAVFGLDVNRLLYA